MLLLYLRLRLLLFKTKTKSLYHSDIKKIGYFCIYQTFKTRDSVSDSETTFPKRCPILFLQYFDEIWCGLVYCDGPKRGTLVGGVCLNKFYFS